MKNVGEGMLKDITRVIIETDEKKPVPIAVITYAKIDTADGYRVRMRPNYED